MGERAGTKVNERERERGDEEKKGNREKERERIRVGDRIANVITRRAFSPQLTERTGPEASGPRNDDTFHEGRKRVRRKLPPSPVDGSSFIRRRTDQSNDSADCAETLLNTREYFICLPASPLLVTRTTSPPVAPRIISSYWFLEREWIIRVIRFSFLESYSCLIIVR